MMVIVVVTSGGNTLVLLTTMMFQWEGRLGLPSLDQVILGSGLPYAAHVIVTLLVTLTV